MPTLMSSTRFITGHKIYNLAYTYKLQLKNALLALRIKYWSTHKTNKSTIGHYNWTQFFQVNLHQITIFWRIVYAETILFWKWKMWKFSYSFHIMAIFYFKNWIVAANLLTGLKLFKEGNYLREYSS